MTGGLAVDIGVRVELPATVVIRDDAGDEVARGRVTVVIGPTD